MLKTFLYEGRYSKNLIKYFKWSSRQKIKELNNLIEKEQNLINIISQSRASNFLRKKINLHVENIKKDLENEKDNYFKNIRKQERNFEGQKKLLKEINDNPFMEVRETPLKQKEGEIYQKGVDVLLATDLIHLAHTDAYDIAVVLSGDTDLREAVKLVKGLGKTVIIVSYHTPGDHKKSNISDLMNHGKFINLRELTQEEVEKMSDLRKED